MERGRRAISGWPAMLLAPILIPFAVVARILKDVGPVDSNQFDLKPEEVAEYIRDLIEGTGGRWDGDQFENMRLDSPAFEAIRRDAVMAGPPSADIDKLRECLARAEALRG